jgi:hypothetical protein
MSQETDRAALLFAIAVGIVALVVCAILFVASDRGESPLPLTISAIGLLSVLLVHRWRQNRTKRISVSTATVADICRQGLGSSPSTVPTKR